MSEQRKGEVTALGGRLIWWGRDNWAWSDGTPAAGVRDITPSWYYNFRLSGAAVEVPAATAKVEPELAWVLRGSYPRGLSGLHGSTRTIHMDGRETRTSDSGKVIPEVILVPSADWDEWSGAYTIGPKWDKTEEEAILAKARSLGWESPQ